MIVMKMPEPRRAAVAVIAATAALVTVVMFASSYRNLIDWAQRHDVTPAGWAFVWPVGVDSFIVLGEAWLFAMVLDRASWGWHTWGWMMAVTGLAASTVANIGHAGWDVPWAVMATYAVLPVAATAGLATLLGLVRQHAGKAKRKAAREAHPAAPHNGAGKVRQLVPAEDDGDAVKRIRALSGFPDVSIAEVARELHCRFGRARTLLEEAKS